MMRRLLPLLSVLGLVGCDRDPAPPPTPPLQAGFVAEHDFGTIPHGETRAVELTIPLPTHGGPWIPVGFQRSCTCAKHAFTVVGPDGTGRRIDDLGRALPGDAVPAGGTLRMTLTIDTGEKEAADLDASWTAGQVVLQEASASARRELLPVRFAFGIRTPLQLVPFAHVDVGDVAHSLRYEQSFEIVERESPVQLGTPTCVEVKPDLSVGPAVGIEVRAEPGAPGHTIVHVAVHSRDQRTDGPFAASILIPTNLPNDYVLRIPVSGTVVPDLQVAPPGWFSFGPIPFDAPREAAVVVTDHDLARSADFHVVGIVDAQGQDFGERFEARTEPIAERPRSRSIVLRYRGGLDAKSFRGEVLLAKAPDGPIAMRIEFAGFAKH